MRGKQLLWPTLQYSVFLGGLQKSNKKPHNKNSHHRPIASRIRTVTPNDYNTVLDPIYFDFNWYCVSGGLHQQKKVGRIHSCPPITATWHKGANEFYLSAPMSPFSYAFQIIQDNDTQNHFQFSNLGVKNGLLLWRKYSPWYRNFLEQFKGSINLMLLYFLQNILS